MVATESVVRDISRSGASNRSSKGARRETFGSVESDPFRESPTQYQCWNPSIARWRRLIARLSKGETGCSRRIPKRSGCRLCPACSTCLKLSWGVAAGRDRLEEYEVWFATGQCALQREASYRLSRWLMWRPEVLPSSHISTYFPGLYLGIERFTVEGKQGGFEFPYAQPSGVLIAVRRDLSGYRMSLCSSTIVTGV